MYVEGFINQSNYREVFLCSSNVTMNQKNFKVGHLTKTLALQKIRAISDKLKSENYQFNKIKILYEDSEDMEDSIFIRFSLLMAINHIVFIDKSVNRIITYLEFYNNHNYENNKDFINSVFQIITEELNNENILICDCCISDIFQNQLEETNQIIENCYFYN